MVYHHEDTRTQLQYKVIYFNDFRGLDTNGDYGYVVLETVEFYLHSR